MNATFAYLGRALVLSTVAALAGCSTGSDAEDDVVVENSEAAVVSCGAAKYNEALAHYKNAVAWSKDRLARGVCESEHGYQWSIADEASRAVMTCGAFRETIKSSPWAPALRTVLADSLTLRSLTGELLVIKDSQWQNWTGTEALLARGVKFWAQSNGAVGSRSQLILGANGKGTFQYVDTESNDWRRRTEPATFTVEKPNGEKGKRRIVVKHGNLTEAFLLSVEPGWQYDDAPIFTLTPERPLGLIDSAEKMYSLVSECDA
ncbi:MAG: hypothetical protein KIT84_32575 [Labilithrix sp.]|nr:hypothetical protein [Labilithrix sp.]MCW5815810.1 hypothetical protein [Labilithrix sp.]